MFIIAYSYDNVEKLGGEGTFCEVFGITTEAGTKMALKVPKKRFKLYKLPI